MSGLKNKIKKFSTNISDRIAVKLLRNNDIRKYKKKCRVEIYSKVKLSTDQKKAIDDLYKKNYGKKIPYVWHQNFMAHSGNFDAKYFPELLYVPEFEHFMNLWPEYGSVFSDKNVICMLADIAKIKMPNVFLSVCKALPKDGSYNALKKEDAINLLGTAGRVFIKPTVDSCSGRGCFIADFENGVDKLSNRSADEIYNSLGSDFVVQDVVKCHASISEIYSGSVNTLRIITYRWKDEILHMPVIMRIGRGGSYVDNAHAGGMFIALDDDGTMHKTAMTEFNIQYTEHPDTGLVFENYKIDLLPDVIAAAKKMHTVMPQVGVVNWDFTIDEDGEPLLIEANSGRGGSVWLPEMAHGCGPFGERTEEVLQWMRKMKSLPKTERYKFAFGKMQ